VTDLAIRVQEVSKLYRIGERQRYKSLRETIMRTLVAPFRKGGRRPPETIWALSDVSFEVMRGEVIGVIGRNGAGKSTLLKILSRITEPTQGRVEVYGRVGSLLEVGTGFHQELTGRENIYLNGAILGMKRAEIERKFDEIVAFAEVEKFLDTPVKHYSTGMYLRLAFAVAAHLEPEILLVDEVLAVGDASFQKKCLGKMGEVANQGRTVLFVSHDMTAIRRLCQRAIWLDTGRVAQVDDVGVVVASFLNSLGSLGGATKTWSVATAPGDDRVRILSVAVTSMTGEPRESLALSGPILLVLRFEVNQEGIRLNPVFVVKSTLGVTIFSTANYEDPEYGHRLYSTGTYQATCTVPAHVLNDGLYVVDALLVESTRFVRAAAAGAVSFSTYDDGSTRGDYLGDWVGIVRPRCHWRAERLGRLRD
jgi:lipopolysaccharide transport system ATP-binding protein